VTGALVATSGDTNHMPICLACTLPEGEGVSFHYDYSTRVLLLDFTQVDSLTVQHKQSIGVLNGALVATSGDTNHMPICLACTLPEGEGVSFHYDCSTRVLLLDFTQVDSLTVQHKQSIGKLAL
jgi:hypothetical protein